MIGDVPLPVLGQWTGTRDLQRPPAQTFRDWWAAEHASAAVSPAPAGPGPAEEQP